MPYLTDKQLATLGISPEVAGQVLADAQALYGFMDAKVGLTDAEVAAWANAQWGAAGPDRMRSALGLLTRIGRIRAI